MPEPPTYWITINAPDGSQIGPPVHVHDKERLPDTLQAIADGLALPVVIARQRPGLWYWEDETGLSISVAREAVGEWTAAAARVSTALSILSGGHQTQAQAQAQPREQQQRGRTHEATSDRDALLRGDDLWIAYASARNDLNKAGVKDVPHVRFKDAGDEAQVRSALTMCRSLLAAQRKP